MGEEHRIWRQMWKGIKGLSSLFGTHLPFSFTLWFVWSILKSEIMCILVLVCVQIYPVSQDPNRLSLQHSRMSSSHYVIFRPRFHQWMSATFWVPPHCWVDTKCCIGSYFSYLFLLHISFSSKSIPLVRQDRNLRILIFLFISRLLRSQLSLKSKNQFAPRLIKSLSWEVSLQLTLQKEILKVCFPVAIIWCDSGFLYENS